MGGVDVEIALPSMPWFVGIDGSLLGFERSFPPPPPTFFSRRVGEDVLLLLSELPPSTGKGAL